VTARLSPRRRVLVAVVTVVLFMTAAVAGFAVTRGDGTGGSRVAQERLREPARHFVVDLADGAQCDLVRPVAGRRL
jgi:hypothetical protein